MIIAGWASNSKYAFLGALRASAQMVSYEIAMGFALVVVLMVSASLNMTDIVLGQGRGWFAERGAHLPELELAAAAADLRRLRDLGHRRDQPRAVRRRRGRVRDRRRPHGRVLGHGVRDVLPRRVRQHPPGLGAGGGDVPRRLDGAGVVRRSSACRRPSGSSPPPGSGTGSGCSPRPSSSPRCSSGCGRPSRASATTRSCGSAGRSSFRSRWSGWSSSAS